MAWSDVGVRGNAITHSFNVEYKGGGGLPQMTASLGDSVRDLAMVGTANPNQITAAYHHPLLAAHGTGFNPGLGAGTARKIDPSQSNGGHNPLTALNFGLDALQGMKSGLLSHFDSGLSALYKTAVGAPQSIAASNLTHNGVHTNDAGVQYVTVDITATNGNGASLVDAMHALGMTGVSAYAGIASGNIEVGKIGDLGAMLNSGNLGFARESGMQSSALIGQQDSAEYADVARGVFGVDGSGFRIGVLSDSFDANAHAIDHMADNIASDDLPEDTTILQDVARGTDEGRAMAQLIHDIAPGASIDFATAFGGQAGFANNILNLALNGDSVIVDDVIYYAELAYQEGPIAQAIDFVKNHFGVSYFSSAGNNGHEGLEQAWTSGGNYFGETLMQFAPGQDYLPVTLAAGEVFILQWDEPGASAGGSGSASDLDLFLTNQDGSAIYAYSLDFNTGGDPVEGFSIGGGAGGTYYLRVGLYSGPAPTEIKLMALGNGAPVDLGTTAGNFNDGTMYGHASAAGANAIGATRYDGTPVWGQNPPTTESFTSEGPTRIWFDISGNRLATPDDRGVDFTAVDGANTTFFGFDYESDGFRNFFGTSAAAPDAAAVALLMKSADAGLTPDDIRNLLADSAADIGTNGIDQVSGAGLIQADYAVAFATTHTIQNDDAVVLLGTHYDDVIIGNGNANIIDGGLGDDIIVGGIRGDTMAGGAGADVFVFNGPFDAISHVRIDTILDLTFQDTIDVSGIDADYTQDGDQDFTLVSHHTDGNVGELEVHYHNHGKYAGETTIKGWSDANHKVDFLVVLIGNHEGDAFIIG